MNKSFMIRGGRGMKKPCRDTLEIADDYGDNVATMTCQLPAGHQGQHIEQYGSDPAVIVLWDTKTPDEDESK